MVKTTRLASVATLVGLVAGTCLLGAAPAARALSTSDKPAAILVWPKIVVDLSGLFSSTPTDTLVQLSNTSTTNLKQAHCFYINANSHCADTGAVCQSAANCPSGSGFASCVPGWDEIDFDIILTRDQPLAWYAGSGLQRGSFPIEGPGVCSAGRIGWPCSRNSDCGFPGGVCNLGQTNLGSGIPPVPETPFIGALKCIEMVLDASNNPVPDLTSGTSNTLKGEAAIVVKAPTATGVGVDVQKYNAIGLQATGNPSVAPTNVLQIGHAQSWTTGADATQEYQACPAVLILNHLFDGATDPISATSGSVTGTVSTELTLVPCGDNFLTQTPGDVTAQFLVFNEFEQRFSTATTVDCFFDSQISKINTRNSSRSIFSAGVAGTIAGQTRIRGVGDAATGRGLLGVASLSVANISTGVPSGTRSSAAYNLHQQADPIAGTQPDLITYP